MREILFKGKRLDNGEWVEGQLSVSPYTKFWYIYPVDGNGTGYEVIPETVEQFTGYLDKHGKKIFEFDIVRIDGEDCTFAISYSDQYMAYQLLYRDDCGGVYYYTFTKPNEFTMEVIGNCWENPEVFEVKIR